MILKHFNLKLASVMQSTLDFCTRPGQEGRKGKKQMHHYIKEAEELTVKDVYIILSTYFYCT